MGKYCFVPRRFSAENQAIIEAANRRHLDVEEPPWEPDEGPKEED